MKRIHLLLPLWIVILGYALLSFLVGDHGLLVMHELEEQKVLLETNLEDLARINRSLEARLEALKNDPEAIALEARALGLGVQGESRILIVDRGTSRPALSAGLYLEGKRPEGVGDTALKKIALSVAALLTLMVWALIVGKKKTRRQNLIVPSCAA